MEYDKLEQIKGHLKREQNKLPPHCNRKKEEKERKESATHAASSLTNNRRMK
jgi:hypothetical protein